MFQRALDLDPNYGEALAGLAWSHLRDVALACTESKEESLAKGFTAALKAVEIDDGSSIARYVLGTAYVWAEKFELAVMEAEKALELNPFNAHAQMGLGNRLDLIGRTTEGIAQMERSLKLNPRDPACPGFMAYLSRAYVSAGGYETALQWARKAVSLRPEDPDIHYRLAVCLAHLDRPDEACAALEDCDRLQSGFVAKRTSWRPYQDAERNERYFAGLQRHGLR
jgi:Flp pilus assembly protein TadD